MLKLSVPTRTEWFRTAIESRRSTTGLLGTDYNDTRGNNRSAFPCFKDERDVLFRTLIQTYL